jgi:signal transduction histidine kinase
MNNSMSLTIIRIALLLAWGAFLLSPSQTSAQQAGATKRVLVLYWYDRDYPGHIKWDQSFQAELQATPGEIIEHYPEYLEANRFPGEHQSQALRDYLRQKYADRPLDVVVAHSEASLNFLLKYHDDLFPHTPVVFYAANQPKTERLAVRRDLTGLVIYSSYKRNLELALSLQPLAKQVFVISGTLERDKQFEGVARNELKYRENSIQINYLTDLSPNELITKIRRLPKRSIILYVWQQSRDEQGKLWEPSEIIDLIVQTSPAPVYSMSGPHVGRGVIGGYVYTPEASAAKVAKIVHRILSGERAQDIPIEGTATVPMFDWRELQRWKINEESLPPGSIVRFKEPTFWQQYKWHIIAVLSLVAVQTVFIGVLLIERRRRRRAKEALDQLNAELEQRIATRTAALDAKSHELETFAYSVAHDLKAPLRGIDGYSKLLIEDHGKDLNKEARSFLGTIQTSTEEMSQLIDDLLAYSRLERREFKPDRLELQPLIAKIVEQKKRESTERSIDFVVDVNGSTVLADAHGLIQSLSNYLDNAVKFTRNVSHARIEIGSKETLSNCLLWVRDNGIGFDSKYQDRIFDIFQRLNPSEDYQGTGIGLAIVRKAMERMGGKAWAESEPGQGATFYLEIPNKQTEDLT